jgi:hypothetical protein
VGFPRISTRLNLFDGDFELGDGSRHDCDMGTTSCEDVGEAQTEALRAASDDDVLSRHLDVDHNGHR